MLRRRYRLDEVLGRGGWATVYRARDLRENEDVAVKVLLPALRARSSSLIRFLAEARTLSHLYHPHVRSVRGCGQAGKSVFLVLELLEGRSLSEEILHEAPIPPPRAVRIALQICDGLGAAHDRAIVHRDLKPDNVLLVRGGRDVFVKVADFGIARSLLEEGERDGARFAGTPAYASPEQASGSAATARSDFYSLGLVLYEMLSGESAFPHESPLVTLQRRLCEPPPEIRRNFANLVLPDGLGEAVTRLLAKTPEDRPGSAADVRALLAPFDEDARAPQIAERAEAYDLPSTYKPLNLSPPLAGRDVDLAPLLPMVRRLGETEHGMLVVVAGAGGVGKSHVAAHLADVACAERGAHRFSRECSSDGRELVKILEELIGEPSPARLTEILGDARSAQELLRILHPAERDRPLEHDVQAQHDYHCQVILDTLAHFAAQQPLVLVLDDVHAADALTRAAVARLPLWSRDRGKGLLVLATWTIGEGPEPPAEANRERFADRARLVRLEPLTDQDSDALLRSVGPLDAEARALIVRLAAGNPLHLFQLLRHLRFEKLLVPTRRGWRMAPRARLDFSVPPATEGLAALQVRQLRAREPLAADLLERAALAGDRVPLALLRGLIARERRTDLAERLDTLLDLLTTENFVQRSDDALVFPHALIRQAIAAGVADPSPIHLVLAQALLATRSADPEATRAAALHLLRGGDPARALPLALRAARTSRSRGDIPRACEDYHLAQRILEAMKKPRRSARLEVALGLGDTLLKLGQTRDAEEHFVKALALGKTAEVHEGLGHVAETKGDYPRAKRFLSRAERQYLAARRTREAADVAILLGRAFEHAGDFDAARGRYQGALDRFHGMGDVHGVARAKAALGFLHVWTGDQSAGLELAHEALPVLEAGGDPLFVGRCLCNVGDLQAKMGEYAAAVDFFQRGRSWLERSGALRHVASALQGTGTNRARLGFHDEAGRMLETALRLCEDMENGLEVAGCLVNLGFACRLAGKLQESVQWSQSGLDRFRAIGTRVGIAIARTELALTVLKLGELDRAESELLSILGDRGSLAGELPAECWEGLGDISCARGDPVAALDRYSKAAQFFLSEGLTARSAAVEEKMAAVRDRGCVT